MKIALLCEGTYPHMRGGVSVWCDQLIAGLPEHDFHVYALSAQRLSLTDWPLPHNVKRMVNVPLWETQPDRAAVPSRTTRPQRRLAALFDEAYDRLIYALFVGHHEPLLFVQALRRLFDYAQQADLGHALLSRQRMTQLYQTWRTHTAQQRQDHRAELLAPTLADALQASLWLEHFLRPLSCPPPQVDVCHATSNGLSPLIAFACKWTSGTPFVLTEHGIYLRERYLELRGNTQTSAFKSFLLRFYRLLTSAAYSMADLVTPGSHYNERWAIEQGADARRIRPVYNGINPIFFPVQDTEPEQPTISWVGRVDPLKDLGTLIRAFGVVQDAMPQARLRMFGAVPKGNEQYAGYCKALIQQYGLEGRATFEGHITDVVDAYHAGHMVALTSISEGFPYTLIEAMAAGRATVATDVGGVSEALGDTGLIVPSRDHQAVAHASLTLLRNAALRLSLGQAARQRVLTQFTLDSFLEVYRQLYPMVVGRRLPARWAQ